MRQAQQNQRKQQRPHNATQASTSAKYFRAMHAPLYSTPQNEQQALRIILHPSNDVQQERPSTKNHAAQQSRTAWRLGGQLYYRLKKHLVSLLFKRNVPSIKKGIRSGFIFTHRRNGAHEIRTVFLLQLLDIAKIKRTIGARLDA